MLLRLKFEIQGLFEEIYNERLPESVFTTYGVTFADLQSAGLQSIVPIVNKLRENGRSDDYIRSHVYAFMENEVYLNYVMVRFSDLPVTFDIYKESINMKFDVLVGNPPYQSNSDNVGAGHTLWDKFVLQSLTKNLKENGFSVLVHPSGWRNIDGSFNKVKQEIQKKDLIYLEIHNIEDGIKTFGAATRYDICVIKNDNTDNLLTKIVDEEGNETEIDVKKMNFIPNTDVKLLGNIIAEENVDKVELCFSHTNYDPRKPWMSNELSETNHLPCVKYISKVDNTIDFRYSSLDKGMFGKPKVMFGIGSQVGGIIPDYNGEYGLCQFVAGIVDSQENLENIAKALKSEKFKKIMRSCQFTTQMYNYKIISNFKKNFWEEFINE